MQFQTCINLSQRHWLICASTIVLFCAMITGRKIQDRKLCSPHEYIPGKIACAASNATHSSGIFQIE